MYTVTKGGPFFFSSSAGPVSGQWEAGRGARIKTVFSFSYFIFIFFEFENEKEEGKKGQFLTSSSNKHQPSNR
jgi:hypothetical protein